MANKRLVWSGGNNTGGSISGAPTAGDWTNAYTTLQGALTARLANEEVWVHVGPTSTHSEVFGVSQTFTCGTAAASDPVLIKGVNKDSSNVEVTTPSTTVNLDATGGNLDIHFNLNCTMRGINVAVGRNINVSNANEVFGFFNTCKFSFNVSGASGSKITLSLNSASYGYNIFTKCEFNCDLAGSSRFIQALDGYHSFIECTFTGTYQDAVFGIAVNQLTQVDVIACNLSSLASGQNLVQLDSLEADSAFVTFKQSKLPTNFVATSSTWNLGSRIEIINSDSGNALYRTEKHNYYGSVVTDSSSFLTSSDPDKTGSTTGTNISYKMSPRGSQVRRHSFLSGPPIMAYISTTGSKTFSLQAIENYTTALKDSEAWMDVYYLDDSGSPLWKVATTRVRDDHLEAALTAGSGTGSWTTPPTGSRSVKFEKTVTVNHVGYYQVIPVLGKFETGKVLHYNPQVTVT